MISNRRCRERDVRRIFTSWNQVRILLLRIDALRHAAWTGRRSRSLWSVSEDLLPRLIVSNPASCVRVHAERATDSSWSQRLRQPSTLLFGPSQLELPDCEGGHELDAQRPAGK